MKPLVFGHRGASIELPENTLAAFERAVQLGVDVIETDVHVTFDGHVVVHHDPTGERMACAVKQVATCNLEEVQRWNVAFGFRDKKGQGIDAPAYRVPTLEEALRTFRDVRFNIDIKAKDGAQSVVDMVRRCGAEGRVLLTSFHDSVVKDVHDLGYKGETGLARNAAARALALPLWAPKMLRPKGDRIQLPVAMGPVRLAIKAVIERLQALGYKVDFWVVNDAEEAKEIAAEGADGIMTDDPRLILPAVRPPEKHQGPLPVDAHA